MAISKITTSGIAGDTLTAADIAANAVGTSELADSAVTGANIAYLGDGSGNLSGTITNQQLHLGTAFTLTGTSTLTGAQTMTGDTTHNGNVIVATNKKVQQKGAFMQSSTHQALTLGG